jgi:hypothetical protein
MKEELQRVTKSATITVPCTPFGANQLIRFNATRKGRQGLSAIKKQLKNDAYLAWCEAGQPRFTRCRYDVLVVFGRPASRDADNFSTGSLKYILDALKGHAYKDDSWKYLERGDIAMRYERSLHGDGRIEVTFTETSEERQ